MNTEAVFWQHKSLAEMNDEEWELLCDGCARCCLHKLEDEDSGIIYYTDVACRLLDNDSCQCKDYARRKVLIRDCIKLNPNQPEILEQMPPSCAYRLLSEGRSLPHWHHLVSGNRETVHIAGISVRGRTTSEDDVTDYEDHIVDWPLQYDLFLLPNYHSILEANAFIPLILHKMRESVMADEQQIVRGIRIDTI